MPDAQGNFKGAFYTAEAWERIFGKCDCTPQTCTCIPTSENEEADSD